MRRRAASSALAVGLVVGIFAGLPSCGSESTTNGAGGDGGGSGDGAGDDGGGGGKTSTNYACPGCPTFPDLNAPACDPAKLGPSTIAYPTDGLLLPPNMNVLEVQFVPPQGATLFEVDFENGVTDVRVETKCALVPDVRGQPSRGCGVTLPQAAWNDVANTNRDGDPVHVTVRATTDGSCVSTSQTKIDLDYAKEDLAGGIYYWQSATFGGVGGKTGGIYQHDFGSFDPNPVPFYVADSTGTCVGCHTLSRDGARMAVLTDDPDGDDELGDVKFHVMDVAARSVLGGKNASPGFQAFTHDHGRIVASTPKSDQNRSFDVFDGDGVTKLANVKLPTNMAATEPDISRDDQTLLYVVPATGTIDKSGDMHFFGGSLYASDFDANLNTLSAPTAVLTSTGDWNYYYPSFSPDKKFIVLNDAPQPGNTATGNNDAFYNRNARVKILHYPPQAGEKPLDLPALNVADGLTNSWPKWSPFIQEYKGHHILWVTFSSNRDYGLHLVNKGFDNCYPPEGPTYDDPQPLSKQGVTYQNCAQPQIWMAAVIVDEDRSLDGADRSFPAFWLPFQDVNSHNHTAQWVETLKSAPPPDGGTCGESGASCGTGTPCCADQVCCSGACQAACVK